MNGFRALTGVGRRLLPGVMLAAAAWAWPARPAAAQPAVLDQAPAAAEVVLSVKNLSSLNQKVGEVKQAALPPMVAMQVPGNPLSQFKRFVGTQRGFDDEGGMLVTLTDLSTALREPGKDPGVAFVLPVSEYASFAKGLGGNAEGLSEVTVFRGKTGYVRNLGNGYAVLARQKSVAKNYEAGGVAASLAERAGSLGGESLSESDAALWVDAKKLGPLVLPQLKQGFAQARQQMGAPGADNAMIDTAKQMMTLYETAANALLSETESAVVGLDLSGDGVGLNMAMQAIEGSTLAEYFPGGGVSPSQLLSRLPNEDYLVATAMDAEGIAFSRVFDAISSALDGGDGGGSLLSIYTELGPMVEQTRASAQAWYVPSNPQQMMQGGAFKMMTVTEAKDPAKYLDASKRYYQTLSDLEFPMMGQAAMGDNQDQDQGQGQGGQKLGFETSWSDDATQVTVDGEQFSASRYQFKMNAPPQMMQQMGPMGMMMSGEGMEGLVASHGNYVVQSTTSDEAFLQTGLKSVTRDSGLGSHAAIEGIREKALPSHPTMASYISLRGIGNMANQFAPMLPMGGAGQGQGQGQGQQGGFLNVPDDLPPLALGLGAHEGGMAFRLYVPTQSAKFVSQSAMKVMMQMQQMQGGQGGPGQQGPAGPDQPGGPPSPPMN